MNEQHPKPSYGDRKYRTDFLIRIYDQGRRGVPTLYRLFLYSQQLYKNIPSIAEAPKPDGGQENQYTAHNPEAANNNCTWEFNAKPYYCCKQRTRDVISDPQQYGQDCQTKYYHKWSFLSSAIKAKFSSTTILLYALAPSGKMTACAKYRLLFYSFQSKCRAAFKNPV